MNIETLIIPEFVVCKALNITNKKEVLQKISDVISHADHRVRYKDILEALLQREKLGSTGIGKGAAIPHARVSNVKNPLCVAMTLDKPIDFDSEDKQKVDLIFGLIVPENAPEEHLEILSSLVTQLTDPKFRENMRKAKNNEELYESITSTKNEKI